MAIDNSPLEVPMAENESKKTVLEKRIEEVERELRRTTEPRNRTAIELRLNRFKEELKRLMSPVPLAL